MSNSDSSRGATQKPDSKAAHNKEVITGVHKVFCLFIRIITAPLLLLFPTQEQEKNAENIKKCEELLTNVEAGFITIIKDLMKKCGQPFTDLLKLENPP